MFEWRSRTPGRCVTCMLLGVVFVVVLVTVPLLGGRLSALGELRLRWPSLALAGIGVQVVIVSVLPRGSSSLHALAHVVSYGLLGACAWANRRVPGVWLIAVGGLLNFAVIVSNGGVMPADPSLVVAAAQRGGEGFVNSGVVADPRLAFLGDVIATPRSWPLANVYSVGDLVIVLGVVVLLHRVGGSRLLGWWPGVGPSAARSVSGGAPKPALEGPPNGSLRTGADGRAGATLLRPRRDSSVGRAHD